MRLPSRKAADALLDAVQSAVQSEALPANIHRQLQDAYNEVIDQANKTTLAAHGLVFEDSDAGQRRICGIVSESGPNREPLACAYPPNPSGQPMHAHSWATLPTFTAATPAPATPAPDKRLRAALDTINRLVALPSQDSLTFQATRARILAILDRALATPPTSGSVDEGEGS